MKQTNTFPDTSVSVETPPVAMLPAGPLLLSEGLGGEAAGGDYLPRLDIRLGDCMGGMKTFPDGHFDLAIVDPPYGIGEALVRGGGGGGWHRVIASGADKWDVAPPPEYFEELFRVSKNQIIWGGNYFPLPPTKKPLCWDKVRPNQKNVSEWEMAWTSFNGRAQKFEHCANGGFLLSEPRIHPTQKPVELYGWLLGNFAKPGDRILDTHLGSGSIAIAAHYAGVHLTAYEIDAEYFHAAKARISRETAQTDMFTLNTPTQNQLQLIDP